MTCNDLIDYLLQDFAFLKDVHSSSGQEPYVRLRAALLKMAEATADVFYNETDFHAKREAWMKV